MKDLAAAPGVVIELQLCVGGRKDMKIFRANRGKGGWGGELAIQLEPAN